jgi:lipopolysaccharide exporter
LIITPFGRRVITSSAWVFSIRVLQQLCAAVRIIVLARIISAEDFAIFGMVLLILSILEILSNFGFKQALIQKSGDVGFYLDTVWSINVVKGLAAAGLLFMSAPFIADFFDIKNASILLRVVSISFVLSGLINISVVYFEKELEFSKYFAFEMLSSFVNLVVTIALAIILRNIWAMVFGNIAGYFTRCGVSYIISSYRPRFNISLSKAKELFSFGKWILTGGIVEFILKKGDSIFVGKFLGGAALGIYQVAFMAANLVGTEMINIVARVMFPAYSILQDNSMKIKDGYLKVLIFVCMVSFSFSSFIIVFGNDIIRILLGDKWISMVPAMQVFAVYAVIRAVGSTATPVFRGLGRPDITVKLHMGKLGLLALFIYPLSKNYGIFGTAASVLLSSLIMSPFVSIILIRKLRLRAMEFLRPIMASFLLTGLVSFGLFIVKNRIEPIDILTFLLVIMVSPLLYTLVFWAGNKIFKLHFPFRESFKILKGGR